jgi:hypothetical protein
MSELRLYVISCDSTNRALRASGAQALLAMLKANSYRRLTEAHPIETSSCGIKQQTAG